MANFDGTDAFFDSRDVIERIAELTAEFLANSGTDENDYSECDKGVSDFIAGLSEEDSEELVALIALRDEAEGTIPDFEYGETFHTWDSLVEYTEETVNEFYTTGELPSWVTNHINWEDVTTEVLVDYTEFEFRGTTYYAR